LRTILRQPKRVLWIYPLPLVGRLQTMITLTKQVTSHSIYDFFTNIVNERGMTFAFCLPGKQFVHTVDPKNIEHITNTRFDNYIKGSLFSDVFSEMLGNGIFNADGELWHAQRKIASRMFSHRKFETHIWSVLEANTLKLTQVLDRTEGVFDMFRLVKCYTVDSFGQIGFSKDIGALNNSDTPFVRSFDLVQHVSAWRWHTPVWKVMRWLQIGKEKELSTHLSYIREYTRSVLKEVSAKAQFGKDDSFISLFMKDEWVTEKDLADQEEFLIDLMINFLIASRDTTAQGISWTLFELMQHPHYVERIRKEIDEVLGDRPMTYGDIQKFQFTKAALDEGLRLHPSVPINARMCLKDDTLPDGTRIPAGCIAGYIPFAQGRCKDLWGDDAAKFRPSRWLEMKRRPSAFENTVFNAGRRECLGKVLAFTEMICLVVSVLRDFDLTFEAEPGSVTYDFDVTLQMSCLPVTVRRRVDK